MLPEIQHANPQLFLFSVPELPDQTLAIGLQQVVEVTQLEEVSPVPFAPPFVTGLSRYRDNVITVIDMAKALSGAGIEPYQADPTDGRNYLLAQMVADEHNEIVAWPILRGANTTFTPLKAPRAETPEHLLPHLIFATVTLSDQPIVVLDLSRLPAAAPARILEPTIA